MCYLLVNGSGHSNFWVSLRWRNPLLSNICHYLCDYVVPAIDQYMFFQQQYVICVYAYGIPTYITNVYVTLRMYEMKAHIVRLVLLAAQTHSSDYNYLYSNYLNQTKYNELY